MDSDQENQFSLFRSQEKPKPWMLKVKIKTEEDRIRPQCICKVCNKGFSSGRALGGHMRVHADQPNNKQQVLIVPTKLETKTTPTCSICGKYFLSMKSLFGHMRCHPERQWRGIQPPDPPNYDNHKVAQVEEDLIDHSYDDDSGNSRETNYSGSSSIENCLPRWTKTSKRGRKALTTTTAATSTTTAPPMPEELLDVVQDLLRLARGCRGESLGSGLLTQIKAEIGDMEDKNSKKELLRRRGSQIGYKEVDCYYSCPVKKLLKTDQTVKGKAVASEEEYDDRLDSENSEGMIINRNFESTVIKRKRLRDLMDHQILQNPIPIDDRFKCSICGKSFSTHQALGGHKSSHSKIRNILTDKTHNIVAAEVEKKGKEVSESLPHRCKICGKSFPTGQALGGHQRRHWVGQQAVGAPSSVTSPGTTSRTSREILGFDLNELPLMEEEEDEHAAGYVDCASNYSFNSVAY